MELKGYIKHRAKLAGGMRLLAEKTGVSKPSLYRISTGDENVTLSVLRKLGVGLMYPRLPKIPDDIA
jgi:predicted transcriptional regulator